MKGFELLDVSLYTEEAGRIEVPQEGPAADEPIVLPEGVVVSVGLTFRLGDEIDGLAFEDTRARAGAKVASTRTALGGFRAGGPYEVRLPSERLPVGKASCGTYEVTGRVVDEDGRALAEERHRIRIEHLSGAPEPWPADHDSASRPSAA
ncbi:hypothetical protein ACIGEZ_29190 [Streptomyces sp. NPDC085481]|uniref:hypothetical protein n=1 Tax=Streptomyces sp. NPDC085481 TaxID=3365727 RepID=UPI0037D8201B